MSAIDPPLAADRTSYYDRVNRDISMNPPQVCWFLEGDEQTMAIRNYVGFIPNPISKCSQQVFVRDGHVIDIEGNPDSPISAGHLCPKGASTYQLLNNPNRPTKVLY